MVPQVNILLQLKRRLPCGMASRFRNGTVMSSYCLVGFRFEVIFKLRSGSTIREHIMCNEEGFEQYSDLVVTKPV